MPRACEQLYSSSVLKIWACSWHSEATMDQTGNDILPEDPEQKKESFSFGCKEDSSLSRCPEQPQLFSSSFSGTSTDGSCLTALFFCLHHARKLFPGDARDYETQKIEADISSLYCGAGTSLLAAVTWETVPRSTSCHYSIKERGRDETQKCTRDQEEARQTPYNLPQAPTPAGLHKQQIIAKVVFKLNLQSLRWSPRLYRAEAGKAVDVTHPKGDSSLFPLLCWERSNTMHSVSVACCTYHP
ncbi:hypothetical protein Anapl_11830 [Anas platyrhynchos]|uniref:Uncharacterized protein n=1 Tax=Anas platyrhynchos TaxID=8839 RepID=R0JZE3_ANAPL|nr:hypothetical protein Anapl_11830 [Anas platyrhynchos]